MYELARLSVTSCLPGRPNFSPYPPPTCSREADRTRKPRPPPFAGPPILLQLQRLYASLSKPSQRMGSSAGSASGTTNAVALVLLACASC
ncbi:uncharacterized protein BDZ99DRAFT_458939 [Mytilinidion resinicola]|uniref:Uncharacterized protein n=1 Tax=Mytilinidion resinicola TaxID=574789 RepID=A0A6A6Z406_9PEZI|nr:uncharacterized protein BDZ99DRAFT_458939 [Mytilinidion resinicola]KAF2814987.1 hypothetical protein BDZ99DRAFT_458939 [Mytilinidion resinicola]